MKKSLCALLFSVAMATALTAVAVTQTLVPRPPPVVPKHPLLLLPEPIPPQTEKFSSTSCQKSRKLLIRT